MLEPVQQPPVLLRPVTVIVLCWNGWPLTERCLATLREHTDLSRARVIVVDNGSTDETPARLAEIDWIQTIRSEQNLGYVRGNNLGMKAADPASDVVLLNNDTEILQDDWLELLQKTASSSPDVGVVGCRLVLPDGQLLHAGAYILPETLVGQQIGSLEMDVGQYAGDREVQAVTFACVYLKRETIDRVGGLSESYESYYEDTDYCLRVREAGLRILCCGDVTVKHVEHGSTDHSPGLFEAIYQRSRAEFGRLWKTKLESSYRYDVHWQSVLNVPCGYAQSGRAILRGLDRLGVRMSYSYVYGPGTSVPTVEPENTGDYHLNVIAGRRPQSSPAISVVYGLGSAFERNRGRYRIGYTMLAVDGFPEEWVQQANEMDEVWVPTHFGRDGMLLSGVHKPIHVMPLGVDTDHFHPGIASFPNPHGLFVFLAYLEWNERSDPATLLRIFNATFSAREHVALICKVSHRDRKLDLHDAIRELGLRDAGGRIRFMVNRRIPYEQLGSLYRSASCFLSTDRGEGFGMPLLEAMACGLPSIATDWGGHTEFVHCGNAYPLRSRGTVAAVSRDPQYSGFQWSDPDPDHLAELLRHVYENREEAAAIGQSAALEVRTKYSAELAAARIKNRLDRIVLDPAAAAEESRSIAARNATHGQAARRPVVAIDVSRAVGHEPSGVGRYAMNIARGIARSSVDDLDFLLLPGFASWVHPEYGRRLDFPHPGGRRIRIYRGGLPAFSSRRSAIPNLALVHSTALAVPRVPCEPLLVTIHDLSFLTHPNLHTRENIRYCTRNLSRALRCGARFVAVSEHTRRELEQLHGVPASRVSVIPNSFDDERFHPYAEPELARTRLRYGLPPTFALFLGTLEPRKNLETVLEAYERDGRTLPPLVVAGAYGWRNEHLRERMHRLRDRVRFLGFVEDRDLGALYAAARVVLYPSIHEGFGLPVLEAMACGTPVITSRVTSLPEVAGDAGVLLDDPRDAGSLVEALRQLVEDDGEHARRVGLGFAQARRFSFDAVTERLLDLYRSLIPAGSRASQGRASSSATG